MFGNLNGELDPNQTNLAKIMQNIGAPNDILMKETFLGLKCILEKASTSPRSPILLIIKNIRTLPVQILNDLIHLISIYRNAPHYINLNLILGVQNNNRDELHLRVSIQNCVKLTIKTFYFPSMKNIIFETISNLLLSRESILTFEPQVIQILIQNINLFGMSIDKFKRMLKALVSEHVFKNDEYFFVHFVPLRLCSKREFENEYKKRLETVLAVGFDEFFGQGLFPTTEAKDEEIRYVVEETFKYIVRRRHFLKAYEVIQDFATNGYKTFQRKVGQTQMQLGQQMKQDTAGNKAIDSN